MRDKEVEGETQIREREGEREREREREKIHSEWRDWTNQNVGSVTCFISNT